MNDICDTHLHVFGPPERYPMVATRSYDPPVVSLHDHNALFGPLGVRRLVLIQPSCYGTDNSCMLDALATLKRGEGRAVAAIAPDISDAELDAMHAAGVRGIRLNVASKHSTVPNERVLEIAVRLRRLGWAIQTFVPIGQLPNFAGALLATELRIVLDHFGSVDLSLGLDQPTMEHLQRMLDTGRCWVKLSAPFRLSKLGPPFSDLIPYVRALVRMRPDRMVWGSDWPYIHHIGHTGPDAGLIQLLRDGLADQKQLQAVLTTNCNPLFDF